MMGFDYGSYPVFSRVTADAPELNAVLGQYALNFTVRFSPNNPPQGALVLDDLHVDVRFAKLGVAHPSPVHGRSFIALRNLTTPQHDASLPFRLHISPSVLEALEECRNGGDAVFHLTVIGNITGYAANQMEEHYKEQGIPWTQNVLLNAPPPRIYEPQAGRHESNLTIPQSDWCRLLEKAGYQNTIFFEIPVSDAETLGAAFTRVKDAQAAFCEGRYADVVARCRDALSSVIEAPDCPWGAAASRDAREKMSVEDRFRLSWCATRHITHAAHHRNGAKAEFTRSMAHYVLGATCLALSLAGKERDLFVKREPAVPTD